MLIARSTDRKDILEAEKVFDTHKIPYDDVQVGSVWFLSSDQPKKAIEVLKESGLVGRRNPEPEKLCKMRIENPTKGGVYYWEPQKKWRTYIIKSGKKVEISGAYNTESEAKEGLNRYLYTIRDVIGIDNFKEKIEKKYKMKIIDQYSDKGLIYIVFENGDKLLVWDEKKLIGSPFKKHKPGKRGSHFTKTKYTEGEYIKNNKQNKYEVKSTENPILETIIGGLAGGAGLAAGFVGAKKLMRMKKNPNLKISHNLKTYLSNIKADKKAGHTGAQEYWEGAAAGALIAENRNPIEKNTFEYIKNNIDVPYIHFSTVLDDSIGIYISLDKPEAWENKIFENSKYLIFIIHGDGALKLLSSGRGIKEKFRSSKIKSTKDAVDRINSYIDKIK